ncbi:MAG: hypothetical protein IKB99_08865 [Lentisphaeria bacterium]|nr:hypothetical protein [Lentisphaeria bacterium]
MNLQKITGAVKKLLCSETTGRKWCIVTVALAFGIVGLAALTAFVVDPHYRYRKPFFYDTVYYEFYSTAPFMLREQPDYDLLMLGSSMVRNFFLNDIDGALKCRSLKLSAAGCTMEDLCKLLDMAVEVRGKGLKRVLWALDIYTLNKTGSHWKDVDFMYRKDHWEDYRYLFSRQTFSSIHYLIKRKHNPKGKRKHQTDRNRMFSTDYDGKKHGLPVVLLDTWGNKRIHHTQTPYKAKVHKENFYGQLLPAIDRNPDIRFTVFLPPYHIYTYCLSEHYKEANALIAQRSAVLLELIKRPNVEVFDFQSDPRYVLHHDYFSDMQHFNNSAARKIMQDIASNRRRLVTPADVKANEKELRALIAKTMPQFRTHLKQLEKK